MTGSVVAGLDLKTVDFVRDIPSYEVIAKLTLQRVGYAVEVSIVDALVACISFAVINERKSILIFRTFPNMHMTVAGRFLRNKLLREFEDGRDRNAIDELPDSTNELNLSYRLI